MSEFKVCMCCRRMRGREGGGGVREEGRGVREGGEGVREKGVEGGRRESRG